jgi:ribosomal protein S18 acetylase RimI-like enzyme
MISVRKANPSDAEIIIGFQQNMALETENLYLSPDIVSKGVNAVFANPPLGQYWVAEENRQVIASLMITYEWSDWRNSNVWWFQSVYVKPSHRRKGVFTTMYGHIKNEAERLGVPGLRLYVETNNTGAIRTYEALGMNREHYSMYEWMKD